MAKRGKAKSNGGIENVIGTILTGAVLLRVATRVKPNTNGQCLEDERIDSTADVDRGRNADRPRDLTKLAWRDILKRTFAEMKDDGVPLMAAGMGYYGMLALFPALVAVVSIYGMLVSPSEVAHQVDSLTRAMPAEARQLVITQLQAVTAKSNGGLGVAAVIGVLGALWSASTGMKWLLTAISRAYDESEERKFVKLRGLALMMTIGAVVAVIVSIYLLVGLPSLSRTLGLGDVGRIVLEVLRWPILACLVVFGLSVLYRYGGDRDQPKWRWVTWGSAAASAIWLLASVGVTLYASLGNRFDKTYGAAAGVIVIMLWLYLSGYAVLFGAELNAEMEHQTAVDTTEGPARPMGARDATVADEVGAATT